jgi:hypothetical protein
MRIRLMIVPFIFFAYGALAQSEWTGSSERVLLISGQKDSIDKPSGVYPIPSSNLLWKRQENVRAFLKINQSKILSKRTFNQGTGWGFTIGSKKNWYGDDLTTSSTRYQVPSTCRAIGQNCYIFVEDASWNSGKVNQSILDSLQNAFNVQTPANPSEGIFSMVSGAFGNPANVDTDDRVIILLLDIKDGFSGSGGYVAGYFNSFNEIDTLQPGFETSNFAEILFLDTYPLNLLTSKGLDLGSSTMAHEFQHLIHFNNNDGQILFINEGCSLVSEVYCGYPIYNQVYFVNDPGHYLFDWSYNDLYSSLGDYSRAARFFTYLRDQFGMGIFRSIVSSSYTGGEDCINDALTKSGSSLRFLDVFQNWCIANAIDDRTLDPSYGYIYPNLPKPNAKKIYVPNVTSPTLMIPPYSSHYISFLYGSDLKIKFPSAGSDLIVKVIEMGQSGTRILTISPNIEFSEPLFGSVYTKIFFVPINLSPSKSPIYICTASGNSGIVSSVVDTFAIPIRAPSGICFDGQSFLIPNYYASDYSNGIAKYIYKINSRSYQITDSLPEPDWWTSGLAWDGSNIWLRDCYQSAYSLIKFSPSGTILNYFPVGYSTFPTGIAWDGIKLYCGKEIGTVYPPVDRSMIYTVDPSSGIIMDSVPPPSGHISGLVFFDGNLYYCDEAAQAIFKIDSQGNIIWAFPSPGTWPSGLTMARGYLWNVDWGKKKVYQIDIGVAPAIPKNLFAERVDSLVRLTWTPNMDPDFLHYKIYRSAIGNSFSATCIDSIRSIGTSSYLDRNVTKLQQYFYWISAVDSSNYESNLSQ